MPYKILLKSKIFSSSVRGHRNRMRFLIFLAIIGAALAVPKNGQRIVGGAPTTIDIHPYMSNMQYGWFGIVFSQACGGSLITTRHVASAAHCYEIDHPLLWRAVLGTSEASSGGTWHEVSSIVIHAEYSSTTRQHDVAVLTLDKPAALSNTIQTIALGSINYNLPDGTPLTAIGWGALSCGGNGPEQLQSVVINTINQEVCAARYAHLKTQPGFQNWPDITPGMLCAGILDVGGKDVCQGDAGGPVVHYGGPRPVQVGIASWGYGCAHRDYPGVLTRVSSYADWFKSNAV